MDPRDERPTKPRSSDRERDHDRAGGHKSCTHCGSKIHDDRGCWKRLTCQKCGRRGHPSDKCLYGCAACGEVHDGGNCPKKKFYNILRKWYVPTKHAGMLPRCEENVKLGRSPGWNLIRAERYRLCIYAFIEKGKVDNSINRLTGRTLSICDLDSSSFPSIASLRRPDEYARSTTKMEIKLSPGKSHGYCKYHTPNK